MPDSLLLIVVGASLKVKGGITRTSRRVCDALPASVRVIHVPTFTCYTGYDGAEHGWRVVQVLVYLAALARTTWYSLVFRRAVFHVHLSQRGSYMRKGIIAIWLRCVGARYLVHTHACDGEAFLRWVPKWVNRLLLWGLHGAGVSLVLTEHWRRYYAEELGFPADRLMVLPNPTYAPARVPARSSGGQVNLLFLGRMGERKGTFDLIRAFASLPRDVRDRSRMMLAGDGETERAGELARSLGCEDRVNVRSWLGPDEVREALSQSDVFLLPSRGEGLSNAVLEAMGWGLAIVTSREGGIDEFLHDGDSALLVQPGNIPEIAGAMQRLVMDDKLRLAMGRRARQAAAPLDLRHHVERLVDVYFRVARRPARPLGAPPAAATESRVAGIVG